MFRYLRVAILGMHRLSNRGQISMKISALKGSFLVGIQQAGCR